MMLTKNKQYKEIKLLWPNVERMVGDAEKFLDELSCRGSGSKEHFVEHCAIEAAKKASAIEYSDDYTYRKLVVFCDEFKECLLDLERVCVKTKTGEWTPDDGPFAEFIKEDGEYTVSMREKAIRRDAYRAKIDAWIKSHV